MSSTGDWDDWEEKQKNRKDLVSLGRAGVNWGEPQLTASECPAQLGFSRERGREQQLVINWIWLSGCRLPPAPCASQLDPPAGAGSLCKFSPGRKAMEASVEMVLLAFLK